MTTSCPEMKELQHAGLVLYYITEFMNQLHCRAPAEDLRFPIWFRAGGWLASSIARSGTTDDRRALALAIRLSQGGTHPVNAALAKAGKQLTKSASDLLLQTNATSRRNVSGENSSVGSAGWTLGCGYLAIY